MSISHWAVAVWAGWAAATPTQPRCHNTKAQVLLQASEKFEHCQELSLVIFSASVRAQAAREKEYSTT